MNLDLKNGEEIVVKGKKPFREKLKDFWSVKKNRVLTIIGIILVILAALAVGFYFLIFKNDVGLPKLDITKEEAKPELYANILDGTMVSQEAANKHPLGIMVENHVDARPQSGLSDASIVYEAIAEGGITRFLAVFSSKGSAKVGPVRSARTYYVNWIKELNGYYSHVGGNYDALELIKKIGILDLDQFANPSAYWRDKSRKVSSEHTMYTDTSKLYGIAADKKYSTDNTFIPYKFVDEPAAELRVPGYETVSINFGNANYNVVYRYSKDTNSYARELAGKPHMDASNNTQITAKNIIIQTVKRSPVVTKINESGWAMETTGSDKAVIIKDGTKIDGAWKKDNDNSRTRFYDAAGTEVSFNRGVTWIEVISPDLT